MNYVEFARGPAPSSRRTKAISQNSSTCTMPTPLMKPTLVGDPVSSPELLYQLGLIVSVEIERHRDQLDVASPTVSARKLRNGYAVKATVPGNNKEEERFLVEPLHVPENGFPPDEWQHLKTWLQSQLPPFKEHRDG